MQAVPDNGISLVGTALTATIDAPPQGGSFAVVPTRLDRQASQAVTPLVGIVLIALLGGLILNLMPCVLPVLALKTSAVIDAAGVGQRDAVGAALRHHRRCVGVVSTEEVALQ